MQSVAGGVEPDRAVRGTLVGQWVGQRVAGRKPAGWRSPIYAEGASGEWGMGLGRKMNIMHSGTVIRGEK